MSARTIAALQIGLECAEQVLAERKLAYAGYPHRWSADEAAVSEIRAALAEAQPVQEPTLPDGRLHADGYFTWNPRHPGYKMDKRTPCDFYLAAPPQPVQEPPTLADVLDALQVFNKPKASEGGDPWTEADFIAVTALPAFIHNVGRAWYAAPPQPVPLTDEQIDKLDQQAIHGGPDSLYAFRFARAIERAHGIKPPQGV